MRSNPSHSSEMVNQLLFGDSVEILDSVPEWLKVRSLFDNYEGWVSDKQLRLMEQPPATDCVLPSDCRILFDGLAVTAPAGASCSYQWLTEDAIRQTAPSDPTHVAQQFLGAPYLWGGRTSMGIDCSGLVQVVYKICGITLPRDASQQAGIGREVAISDARSGDLAFFSNSNGKIVHVGIVDDDGMILHASGRVRRDRLDAKGIVNIETGVYTHSLTSVKRIG